MLPGVRNRTFSKGGPVTTCLRCQWRTFTAAASRCAAELPPAPKEKPAGPPPPPSGPSGPLSHAPRSYGERVSHFTPTPLAQPIGMAHPPEAGENTGLDDRSLRQKRDDFVNYDKHLVKREKMKQQLAKPYFRDWNNMRFQEGKTFLSPPRLFRGDVSLYFPNLYGRTLLKRDKEPRDTTPLLEGKTSVVSVFSSAWAESQVDTFISKKDNPALHEVLAKGSGAVQLVHINVEENAFKAWLIRLFAGSLRRKIGKANWDKYFVVRRGISDEIRECIGLLNSKVGYTYLVDSNCRIRWAGSGRSEPEEREGLAKGAQRLLNDMGTQGGQRRVLEKK